MDLSLLVDASKLDPEHMKSAGSGSGSASGSQPGSQRPLLVCDEFLALWAYLEKGMAARESQV